MRNNERYSAFSPAVSQAFLEVSDLRSQFLPFHLYALVLYFWPRENHERWNLQLSMKNPLFIFCSILGNTTVKRGWLYTLNRGEKSKVDFPSNYKRSNVRGVGVGVGTFFVTCYLSIYSAYLAIRFKDLPVVPPLGRVLPLFEIFIHLGLNQGA